MQFKCMMWGKNMLMTFNFTSSHINLSSIFQITMTLKDILNVSLYGLQLLQTDDKILTRETRAFICLSAIILFWAIPLIVFGLNRTERVCNLFFYYTPNESNSACSVGISVHHRWFSHFDGEVFNMLRYLLLLIHRTPFYSRSDEL